jgi:cytoskeleton protein RodZ
MKEKEDLPAAGETTETPIEAVQDLKAAREARGLSLKDVFQATRVSVVNLEAVENGAFDRLPPPVYARNFIRKYARAVGVDEKPFLDRYERYLESLKPCSKEPEVQKPWPESNRRYPFLFLSLAAVIVAGILVYALFLYDQSGKTIPPAPPVTAPPEARISPAPAPLPSALETSARTSTKGSMPAAAETGGRPALTAGGKMYHLAIEAHELTWIRITADRGAPYQALLRPGDRIERTASDHFQLDIGNAGGLHLTFQGNPLGNLGKSGQVIHLRLPEKAAEGKTP